MIDPHWFDGPVNVSALTVCALGEPRMKRSTLNVSAGRMTAEEAKAFGPLLNKDCLDGVTRRDRFAPAFLGAPWDKVIQDLDRFDSAVRTLWAGSEEAALDLTGAIFADTSVLPGAGRSFPTMLLYLRDRQRFAIMMTGTARGLAALSSGSVLRRTGGIDTYRQFCEGVQDLAKELELEPQEIDLVLTAAARLAREEGQIGKGSGRLTLTADTFDFLRDLRENNRVDWMQANRARYKASLDNPFRRLLNDVASPYMRDVDPLLDSEVKTGHVLGAINKRFGDDEGDYHSYLWGAFSRGRKQEDVQLFVTVAPEEVRFGLSLEAAAAGCLDALRSAAEGDAESLWRTLDPFASQLEFLLDDSDPTSAAPRTRRRTRSCGWAVRDQPPFGTFRLTTP